MKHFTLKTALGLFGLMIVGSGAHAQTTNFNVVSATPGDGQWHVTLVETGNQFSIKITTTIPKPIQNSPEVKLSFKDTLGNTIKVANNGGGVVGKGQGAWTNVVNPNVADWHFLPSQFPPILPLENDGSNYFLGNATLLLAPGEEVKWADVLVDGSIHGPWTLEEQLTPEASSLALLLPGLVPIGIALRRRRKSRA